jgi:hypothetical protein
MFHLRRWIFKSSFFHDYHDLLHYLLDLFLDVLLDLLFDILDLFLDLLLCFVNLSGDRLDLFLDLLLDRFSNNLSHVSFRGCHLTSKLSHDVSFHGSDFTIKSCQLSLHVLNIVSDFLLGFFNLIFDGTNDSNHFILLVLVFSFCIC